MPRNSRLQCGPKATEIFSWSGVAALELPVFNVAGLAGARNSLEGSPNSARITCLGGGDQFIKGADMVAGSSHETGIVTPDRWRCI